MSQKTKKQIEETSSMAGGAVQGGSSTDDYFISREKFLQELQLREVVRKIITISEQKQKKPVSEENKLRGLINKLITEAETDVAPHASTAINFLEDLLKKILPGIETDYKSLTTKTEQRESFRAQMTTSVNTALETAQLNTAGAEANAEGDSEEAEGFIDIEEEIEITVTDDDKFIDIDSPGADETDSEEKSVEEGDATGRKLAAQSFDAIEKQTLETFATLSDPEDQKTFKDYMITNLKLYFDKWEKELGDVIEPTTDEYETEKEEGADEETGEELGGEESLGAEEELSDEEFEL
jgi:hypothetical protein